jgi:hypothetical protein
MSEPKHLILNSLAKLDLISKVTTLAAWTLCLYCVYLILNWRISIIYRLVPSFLLLFIFFLPAMLKPSSFLLFKNGLLIKRPLNSKFIRFDEIKRIDKVEPSLISISRILLNSDGVCGFLGFVRIKGIGMAWSYVTNKNKVILIELKRGKRYLISPQNLEDFFKELQNRIYVT